MRALPALFLLAMSMSGCKPFAVSVGTDQPLKVDIKMKMDVYQHDLRDSAKKTEARTAESPEGARRSRMGEIQALKNSRIVGENRAGLLDIRNQPAGEYGDYVLKTVEVENADRRKLMEKLAREKGLALGEVERSQAALFRQSAFPGEWFEEADGGGGFVWKQKK